MIEIVLLSLLAAVFSIDITALGQFMISRPIVCAPVFGYLLGDIKTGLWVGMMVELIWISAIPMGAAIPQDTTSVAILSVVWGLAASPAHGSAVILALMLAVPVGILFKKIDVWMRYYNVRLVHWVEEGVTQGDEARISAGVYAGLLLFFVKAFLFYLVFIAAGSWLTAAIYPRLGSTVITGFDLAWRFLPVLGFAMFLANLRYGKFLPFK